MSLIVAACTDSTPQRVPGLCARDVAAALRSPPPRAKGGTKAAPAAAALAASNASLSVLTIPASSACF